MNLQTQYNVTLLIEDSTSSKVFQEEIEEFKNKMNNNHYFKEVEYVHFHAKDKKLVREAMDSSHINENNKKRDNNLIFILTDTTSSIWNNNAMYTFLKQIQENALVSIMNILPENLWRNLALDSNTGIKTKIESGIKSNMEIGYKLPFYIEQEDMENLLIIPAVNMNKFDQLVETISKGGEIVHVGLYKKEPLSELENITEKEEKRADEKVANYRFMSTDDAYSLAVFFSTAATFTISDLNFVRQHMLPESDKSIISQFLMGGIVEKTNDIKSDRLEFEDTVIVGKDTPQEYSLTMSYNGPKTIPINPNDIEQKYKMKDGVSQELLKSLRYSEEHVVNILMKEKRRQDFDKDYEAQKQYTTKPKI